MGQTKTNNSYLRNKIELRAGHLPEGEVSVLDCYGGSGRIWAGVEVLTGRRVRYLPIDKLDYGQGLYLPGDNLAYLSSLDLARFNVIDLDAYGVPFDQMEILFGRGYAGMVFVTFIQSVHGALPFGLLEVAGFPEGMVKKVPSLFYKDGWNHFLAYLAGRGVRGITHRSHARKHYASIAMQPDRVAESASAPIHPRPGAALGGGGHDAA